MKLRHFFHKVNKEFLDEIFEAKKLVPQKKSVVKPQKSVTKPEEKPKKKITPEQVKKWNTWSAGEQNYIIQRSPEGVYSQAVKNNIIKLKDKAAKATPHEKDDEAKGAAKPIEKNDSIKVPKFDEIEASKVPDDKKASRLHDIVDKMKPEAAKEFLNTIVKKYGGVVPPWVADVHNHWKDVIENAPAEEKEPKVKEGGAKKEKEEPEDELHHSKFISKSWSKKEREEVEAAFTGKTKPEKLSPEAKKKYEKVAGDIHKAREKKFEKEEGEKRKAEREKIPYASEKITIAGKDKTLRKTNIHKEKAFTEDHPVEESKYVDAAKKFNGKNLYNYPPYKISSSIKMDKVPKKYRTTLERLVNTKIYDETAKQPPITFFTGGVAGAGAIRAQAGEILTMISSTMDDKEFNKFYSELETHLKSRPNKDDMQVVTSDWLKAAKLCRETIHKYVQKKYPGAEIVSGSWDVQSEVEAMGLDNYKKNKGVSTDMYLRIKDKKGKERLVEVSLKKDPKVNLLNSGAGKFKEWDATIPKEIDQEVYSEKQGNKLSGFVKSHQTKINRLIKSKSPHAKNLIDIMSKKKIDLDYALSEGGNARNKKKILLAAADALAKSGDKDAQKFREEIDKDSRTFATKSIQHLIKNEKMREGMLNEIRSEFPLKSVMEKEEMAAIDGLSLDDETAYKIFKTRDWNKIKENLKMIEDDVPYIAYEAESGGDIIPIADINIREDGVGYGGGFKFEMKLSPKFAKILTDASDEIYGMSSERAAKEKAKKEREEAKKSKKKNEDLDYVIQSAVEYIRRKDDLILD